MNTKPAITTVIFDIDDTLFDRRRAQREAIRLIVADYPDLFAGLGIETITRAFLDADRAAVDQFDGGADSTVLRLGKNRVFLATLGLDESFAGAINDTYLEKYPTINAPVPNAKMVVQTLREQGVRVGIISNSLPDMQHKKMRAMGIETWFECVLLSEDVGIRKPEPQIFWMAAGLLGVFPEQCLYVGDSFRNDVVGAYNAGMPGCWYNPLNEPAPRTYIVPDFEIRALDEILTIVTQKGQPK